MPVADLTVTLNRTSGTALLCRADWSQEVQVGDLRAQLQFYRGLWSRVPGAKTQRRNEPGPWARHYEQCVRALEAAVKEVEAWR